MPQGSTLSALAFFFSADDLVWETWAARGEIYIDKLSRTPSLPGPSRVKSIGHARERLAGLPL